MIKVLSICNTHYIRKGRGGHIWRNQVILHSAEAKGFIVTGMGRGSSDTAPVPFKWCWCSVSVCWWAGPCHGEHSIFFSQIQLCLDVQVGGGALGLFIKAQASSGSSLLDSELWKKQPLEHRQRLPSIFRDTSGVHDSERGTFTSWDCRSDINKAKVMGVTGMGWLWVSPSPCCLLMFSWNYIPLFH